MSETKKAPLGHSVWKKVVSWLMIMAMIIGLAPANLTLVANAEETTKKPTIRIYFENSNGWETPVINVWDPGATVNGGPKTDVYYWWTDNTKTKLQQKPSFVKEDGTNFYYVDVTSDNWLGMNILDASESSADDPSDYIGDTGVKINQVDVDGAKEEDQKVLGAINALADGSSVYYLSSKSGWYMDKEGKTPLATEAKTVTLHFLNTYDWTTPVVDAWETNFVTISGAAGTEVVTGWTDATDEPKSAYKLTEGIEENGYKWYSVEVTIIGAADGLQFVDATTGLNPKKLSTEQLATLNSAADGSELYYGVDKDKKDIFTEDKTEIVVPQEQVDVPKRTSPEYKADGKVAFYLPAGTTVASAHLVGTFTSWTVNEVAMERVENETD